MVEREMKIFGQNINLVMRNDGDLAIAQELFLEHQYRFCDAVIKKAKNAVIDIGGHLGFFSLYAGVLNGGVPIYTFEPHAGNFDLLKKNLKLNNIKAQAKQLAVDKEVREVELQISEEDLNHSITQALEPIGEVQKAQTTTLERIFKKNQINHCELIKIDCEGSEFDILYNAPKEVFGKTDHLFIEYHDWIEGESSKELKKFLEKVGYNVEKYPSNKIKELGFLWCTKKGL